MNFHEIPLDLSYELGDVALYVDSERESTFCVDPRRPLTLHCFDSHRTGLRDFHRVQLNRAADIIVASFKGARPVRHVRMIGHAATWQGLTTLQYKQRGKQRANNAKIVLSDILETRGHGGKVRITTQSKANSDPLPGVDNETRRGRALNRRVEIKLMRVTANRKRKPAAVKTCRSPDIVRKIRKAQISNHTSIGSERLQMMCLRELIADALIGKSVDDRYWRFTAWGAGTLGTGHAVTREEQTLRASATYCHILRGKELTPINLSKALWQTHNSIYDGLEKLDRFFRGIPSGNPFTGDPLTGYTECIFAREIAQLARSTDRKSVYRCYRGMIKVRFSRCVDV